MTNFTATCGYSEGTSSEKYILVRFYVTNSVNVQNSVWTKKSHVDWDTNSVYVINSLKIFTEN